MAAFVRARVQRGAGAERVSEPAAMDVAGVVVRAMERDDLQRVAEVEAGTFSMPWSEATFRGLLRRGDVDALVAIDSGGAIAGYAVAWGLYDQGELANIAIVPAWRGSGLAARMLAAVLGRLEARGIEQVFLEVRESNGRARSFYARHGFREIGRRRRYYARPVEDALVLYRHLGERNGDDGPRAVGLPETTFEQTLEGK